MGRIYVGEDVGLRRMSDLGRCRVVEDVLLGKMSGLGGCLGGCMVGKDFWVGSMLEDVELESANWFQGINWVFPCLPLLGSEPFHACAGRPSAGAK
jgi:hypothetical protein